MRFFAAVLAVSTLAPCRAACVPRPDTPGPAVEFDRHVVGLLGRLGCSAGACHGSFQGRGGLRLSLFGQDPEADYFALTRSGMGRLVNPIEPERSLLLLKPTGRVPHGGGVRFEAGSWEEQTLRAWIEAGTPRDLDAPAVDRLEVEPAAHRFERAGQATRLRVTAVFEDGDRVDLTEYCTFRARDETVVEVAPDGEVRAIGPGATSLIVEYRGSWATSQILVAIEHGVVSPPQDPPDPIDALVLARLRALRIEPAPVASDADFLRRLTIDAIGRVPTPEEVRSFLADPDPHKRSRKIHELLEHPRHAALWATRLCEITGANIDRVEGPPELRPRRLADWHEWYRRRIAENVGYDAIVRGVLRATSRGDLSADPWLDREIELHRALVSGEETGYAGRAELDLFWRRSDPDGSYPQGEMAERVASAFLGVQIGCAKCHTHPSDRWTTRDYAGFSNLFARVEFGTSPDVRAAVQRRLVAQRTGEADTGPIPRVRELYLNDRPRLLPDPSTGRAVPPRLPNGVEVDPTAGDPREALVSWLLEPDNPYLAPVLVNRVWARYFGEGLVEPVDGFSASNPPGDVGLLESLARDFVASGYDIRELERRILNSAAYQRAIVPASAGLDRPGTFAQARLRRVPAEAVADSLAVALGDGPGPEGTGGKERVGRAIELASNRVEDPHLGRLLRTFGRSERSAICDCERSETPSLAQQLFLMVDDELLDRIEGAPRIDRLIDRGVSGRQAVDELFLATLSRFPDDDERAAALDHVSGGDDRRSAYVALLWSLVNTREFLLVR
ncbi:DUF1549 domain-containing protein [Tautonia sp. JC769]|uniref:DUF1549 domain-containing protein n=1 Tax=Tautonia sp. JC769 TaxID=3232135 RepID=UPI0034598CA7